AGEGQQRGAAAARPVIGSDTEKTPYELVTALEFCRVLFPPHSKAAGRTRPTMDAAPARDASSPESERYRTLLEINNAVISSLTRDDLFRAIARSLRRIVSFERTAIFLHDQAADVLRLFVLESSLSSDYFTV